MLVGVRWYGVVESEIVGRQDWRGCGVAFALVKAPMKKRIEGGEVLKGEDGGSWSPLA